jgi:hypothetical protein
MDYTPHGKRLMSTILRWFYVDGQRHRAYYRQTRTGSRELVVAGPDWQASIADAKVSVLDDFGESELEELAATARLREGACRG